MRVWVSEGGGGGFGGYRVERGGSRDLVVAAAWWEDGVGERFPFQG